VPVGSTQARAKRRGSGSQRFGEEMRGQMRARAHVGVRRDVGSCAHGCVSALAYRPARLRRSAQQRQARGNPARPMARRPQASLTIKKGRAFGMHARCARRNASAELVHRCAGVRGGAVLNGIKETERKEIERGSACGTTAAAPARKRPNLARRPSSHSAGAAAGKVTLLSARRPGFTEGRRDLSSPRWPRAEGQASVKRWSTQQRGRRRRWYGKQRGGVVKRKATRGDEQARLPPRGRLRLHGDGAFTFWSPASLPHSSTPQTSAAAGLGRNPRVARV
jgi:hypothetical protein